MEPTARHALAPDVSFDGGDLDCGNGLLLLIRKHIDPMERGQLLEIRSTEISVDEDLPSWCRMTGNELVSVTKAGRQRSFLVCKGALAERPAAEPKAPARAAASPLVQPVTILRDLPRPAPAVAIAPLSVMGMGSWPRPRWMIQAIADHMTGRMSDVEFSTTGDDAVRLAMQAQLTAGADVITDGEQRRDSYASFVGGRLDNCQLIPLADLAAMVDDPEEFQAELRALDVPAQDVRHPVVFGKLGRSRPIVFDEWAFAMTITSKPVKVALPGPYLLTRTMWLECLTNRAYETRDELARDVVRVLREELATLLAAGAPLVQFDEPVLSEVVFTGPKQKRSFMCGALSEKGDASTELGFARDLIAELTAGFPRERVALHICRGNWTKDEAALLTGGYEPLLPFLKDAAVGTLLLELSTPRSGEIDALRAIPSDKRIGVGVVNPRADRVEDVDEIVTKARRAIDRFGRERVLLNSDCGFATFAANPVASAAVAAAKVDAMARAAAIVRRD